MVITGTKSPEEMDGIEEAPAAEALEIAAIITETRQFQNMYLKEK